MAYAEKYNLSFSDNRGTVWRIGIFLEGFSGSSSSVKATGDPLRINWKSDGLYTPLRGSEAIVNLLSETDFQFSEFFTADIDDYLLEVRKAGTVWWQGVMITETYTEPYVDPPYSISLRFSCGIGFLKFIEFKTGGLFVKGQLSLIAIIVTCLDLLPFQIKIREIINVLENSIADLDSNGMLINHFLDAMTFRKYNKDTDQFEGDSCFNVLQDILKSIGCTMYQSENKWWIVRIEEYETATPKHLDYTIFGTYDSDATVTVQKTITNTEAGITPILQDQVLKMSEVFDEIVYNYHYKPPDRPVGELITDWEFKVGATSLGESFDSRYPLWEKAPAIPSLAAGTPVKWSGTLSPNQSAFFHIQYYTVGDFYAISEFPRNGLLENCNTLNKDFWIKPIEISGETITYSDLITTVNDTLKIHLVGEYVLFLVQRSKYEEIKDIYYDMRVHISLSIGTFYLKEDTSDGTLSWTTTNTDTFSIKLGRLIKAHDFFWDEPPSSGTYIYLFDEVLETPVLPETAENDVTIIYYMPANPFLADFSTYSMFCDSFNTHFFSCVFQPDNKTMVDSKIIVSNISGIRDRTMNVVVRFGDGVARAVRSAFKLSDKSLTADWYYRGNIFTTFPAATIFILEPYVDYFAAFRQEILGTLYGDLEFSNSFLLDSRIFFADSLNFDVKATKYRYNLIELVTVNTASTDTEHYTSATTPGISNTSALDSGLTNLSVAVSNTSDMEDSNAESMTMATFTSDISEIEETSNNSDNYKSYPE